MKIKRKKTSECWLVIFNVVQVKLKPFLSRVNPRSYRFPLFSEGEFRAGFSNAEDRENPSTAESGRVIEFWKVGIVSRFRLLGTEEQDSYGPARKQLELRVFRFRLPPRKWLGFASKQKQQPRFRRVFDKRYHEPRYKYMHARVIRKIVEIILNIF